MYMNTILRLQMSPPATMSQTIEARAFLERVSSLPKGPGVSLDEMLAPSIQDETELRKLLATCKTNPRLPDPLAGLVDVFNAVVDIRTIRARVVEDEDDIAGRYVMPLSEAQRRKEGPPPWSVIWTNSRRIGPFLQRTRRRNWRTEIMLSLREDLYSLVFRLFQITPKIYQKAFSLGFVPDI